MTSIGNTQTSALFQTQRPPHRTNPVAQAIASDVSAGSISATDGTALSSALDSIDLSLKSSQSSGSGTRLDPSQIKDKVDGLIDDQVSGGSLTSDQAATLKSLFSANAPPQGGAGGPGGPGGPGAPPPPDGDSDATSAISGTTASSSDAASKVGDLLDSFLKVLQTSQTTASGYGASGATGSSASSGALLVDFDA